MASSCHKPDPIYQTKDVLEFVDVEVPVEVQVEVPAPPITNYFFDGTPYSVYTAAYSASEGFTEFFIAREHEEPFKSYIYFAFVNDYMGKAIDITKLMKRIDYRLVFETPNVFYSEYYAPQSGTIAITPLDADNEFELSLDLVLYDGRPLKIFYSGPFLCLE